MIAPHRSACRALAIGAAALFVGGCGSRGAQPEAVATVGGAAISAELLDAFVIERAGESPVNAAMRQSLLAELKRLKAAALIGERSADETFAVELELARLQLLAKRAATAAGIDQPPTEADLQQAYRTFVDALPADEYRLAHILVATEPAATALIDRLRAGADFAELAATSSADPGTSGEGDLGWITPGKVPLALTDAVKPLRAGDIANTPVRTSYGWHVVKLVDQRSTTPPTFEHVRAQVALEWQRARYAEFLEDSLRAVTPTAR